MTVRNLLDERFEELSELVEAGMKRLRVPGAALGVWHKGGRRVAGFGETSVENPLPVTPRTLFQIGSITKTMTSAALMRFVEDGRLDLDQPLRELMPGFSMADPVVTAQATARHLLTHTGGWVGDYFDDFGNGDDALAAMVDAVGRLEQVTPLGEVWSYNNAGFNIAGRLLEILSGKPYETALRELLFAPLGMEQSWFYPDDVFFTHRFAVGHEKRGDQVVVARPWAIGRAGNCVGGGICSVGDLLDYARFMLDGGVNARGERIMKQSTLDCMLEPGMEAGVGKRIGITWNIRTPGGMKVCGHGGATHGQEAALHFAPGEDFAIALLTNSGAGAILTDSILEWGMRLWFGVAPSAPEPVSGTAGELGEFHGLYDLPLSAFTLGPREGGFVLQDIPRGGFPRPDIQPGQPDPPMKAVPCGNDRFLVLDEPRKGAIGEFIRDGDGRVRFCRLGGRVHRKVQG